MAVTAAGAAFGPIGYELPLLYLVWAVAIALLFAACHWYAAVKARRSDWWLSYL